jgi:hypothetical protein
MGYNYTFLILGTHPKLKVEEELYYDSNSGTYGFTANHWFFTHKDESDDFSVSGDTSEYVFYLENLKINLNEDFSSDNHFAIEELQNMVNHAKVWEDKGYADIKIIFGLSP